ncbi:MAG: hypothetical protein WCG76_02480 [Verrucomicrobiota bacterium]
MFPPGFFSGEIDPVLHAHSGVRLRQKRAGKPEMRDAAMQRGRGESGHIKERASPDGGHARVAAQLLGFHGEVESLHHRVVLLGRLASWKLADRTRDPRVA